MADAENPGEFVGAEKSEVIAAARAFVQETTTGEVQRVALELIQKSGPWSEDGETWSIQAHEFIETAERIVETA